MPETAEQGQGNALNMRQGENGERRGGGKDETIDSSFLSEQRPVIKPFAESAQERFNEWLMEKAKTGVTFQGEQPAWLSLIRDHIATSLSIREALPP